MRNKTMINQLSVLGIRFLSVFVIVQGLSGLVALLARLGTEGIFPSHPVIIFILVGPLTAGLALWLFSKPVGRLVSAGLSEEKTSTEDSSIITAGTAVLGMCVAVLAIPDMIRAVFHYMELSELSSRSNTKVQGEIYASVLQLVLGIALVLGKRGLFKLVRCIRYGGTSA